MSNYKDEMNNIQFLNDDMYSDILESEYLLKINFNNFSHSELSKNILKVIIGGNVEIKFLGYTNNEPKKEDEEKEIKKTCCHYGMRTADLFKKYQKIIKILEEAFHLKMHEDTKGYYVETIITEEVETLIRFDKETITNQICSYDKKNGIYFIGNVQENGKINGNGKVYILVEENISLIDLDTKKGEAKLKIPNICKFNNDSSIKT